MFSLFPLSAQAALDCTVESAKLVTGHANTYIVATTNPQVGDFVGTEQLFDIIYKCKVSGSPTQWGIMSQNIPALVNTSVLALWNSSSTFAVLTTAELEAAGLGFSGFWYARNNWPPGIVLDNASQTSPYFWKPLPAPDGQGDVKLGIMVRYRFSKINDNLDAMITGSPIPLAASIPLAAFVILDDVSATTSPVAQLTATLPTITISQRACTPFADTVKLPVLNMNELPPVGQAGPYHDFFIEMRCPSNLGAIGYHAEAVYGVLNPAQGVIDINPASTASGIGLQILTRSTADPVFIDPGSSPLSDNYQPMQFGNTARYGVFSYSAFGAGPSVDPSSNPIGTYRASNSTIPLRVAIYRTSQTVTPGTFNSAIIIHFVYR